MAAVALVNRLLCEGAVRFVRHRYGLTQRDLELVGRKHSADCVKGACHLV